MAEYAIPLSYLSMCDFMVVYSMSGLRENDENVKAWKTYNEVIQRVVKSHPECKLEPLSSYASPAGLRLIVMHTPIVDPPVENPTVASSSSSSSSSIASSTRPP